MKRLLFSTAIAAVAFMASPAFAQDDSTLKLNLGGHFKGYVNYADQDDNFGSVSDDVNNFDILREMEVHFGGETTLDNGLTVGAQIEAFADAGADFELDESYVYLAGTWGRINFGDEDGAAYLLQVAAPSADDNIDGVRQFINPFNFLDTIGAGPGDRIFLNGFDYANDSFGDSDKITYLSPVFSGFQAGVSYAPNSSTESRGSNGNSLDKVADDFSNIVEAAVRYEGAFNAVGIILGAGYTRATLEADGANFNDDFHEWNVGSDFDIGAFGLGAVYTKNNFGHDNDAGDENRTWVVGADYTTGPLKFGVSYLSKDTDILGAGFDFDTDRYTAGVIYSYGPGMSFRGSVSHFKSEFETVGDLDGTAVTLGTQINF